MMSREERPLQIHALRVVQCIDRGGEVITGVTAGLDQEDTVAGQGKVAGHNASAWSTADNDVVRVRRDELAKTQEERRLLKNSIVVAPLKRR
ncbi:hypothetical protein DL546_002745 [Coniochaeta pulveracea]|uniref:Uncharacterized protein n=1 Tax=Coniochaeta pulveracea TaxID=177199 RepID=A0A420YA05_9PEZI|nr:hypothetical protein DL546_002745 [Coniochaeta pulveracea]